MWNSLLRALLAILVFKGIILSSITDGSFKGQDFQELSIKDRVVRDDVREGTVETNRSAGSRKISNTPPIYSEVSKKQKLKMYFTHNILVNQSFKNKWIDILHDMEISYRSPQPKKFTLHEICEAKARLMVAIENDDPIEVLNAIKCGARFLMDFPGGVIGTANYTAIEQAVAKGKTAALNVMLSELASAISAVVDLSTTKIYHLFLGGLLITALQAGSESSFDFLLDSYNAKYITHSYLFQQAIMRRAPVSILARILKWASNTEIQMAFGRHLDFPLHLAVKFNHPEGFAYIFNGTNLRKLRLNGDDLLPIHLLIESTRNNFIEALFKNHPEMKHIFVDNYGNNYLHLLAQHNQLDKMKFLLFNIEYNLEYVNNYKQTALHVACCCSSRGVAEYLIQMGASVFAENSKGISPLLLLARKNYRKEFDLALDSIEAKHQFDLPILPRTTQNLILESKYEYVEKLFKRFSKLLSCQFFFYDQSLQHLISSGKILNFPTLFRQFAIFNVIQTIYKNFSQAAAEGKTEIVKICLELGLRPEFSEEIYGSAVEQAVRNKQPEASQLLLPLTGWLIHRHSELADFKFVLFNGASFNPQSPARIRFNDKSIILCLFIEYFSNNFQVNSALNFPELTTMCAQYDVFLHFHFNSFTASSEEHSLVQKIQFHRKQIVKSHFDEISASDHLLIMVMLTFNASKNDTFIKMLTKCNSCGLKIDPTFLKEFFSNQDLNLARDFCSIFE